MASTTTRLETPYLTIVKRADPTFFKDRAKQPEYEFRRRAFTADPTTRGAYGAGSGPSEIFSDTTPDIGVVEDVFQEN